MTKNTLFILFLCIAFNFCVASDTFVKHVQLSGNYDGAKTITQLLDSSIIMMTSYRYNSVWYYGLTKMDKAGNILWSKRYGNGHDCYSGSVLATSDGGFLLTGGSTSNLHALKVDNTGAILWSKRMDEANNEYATNSIELPNGDLMIAGYGSYMSPGYVMKVTSAGNFIWTKKFRMPEYVLSTMLVKKSASEIYFTGYIFNSITYSNDIFVVKMDTSGSVQWNKSYNVRADERLYGAELTSDGGLILSGNINGNGSGKRDAFLCKTDTAGNVQWFKTYGTANRDEYAYQAKSLPNGEIVIAAFSTDTTFHDYQPLLMKTTSSGNLIWTSGYSDGADKTFTALELLNDQSILAAGGVDSMLIVKANFYGLGGCHQSFVDLSTNIFSPEILSPPFVITNVSNFDTLNLSVDSIPVAIKTYCASACQVNAVIYAPLDICVGSTPVIFNNNSAGANSYKWILSNTLVDSSMTYTHQFTSGGQFEIKLVAQSPVCSDTAIAFLNVQEPSMHADFNIERNLMRNHFLDNSFGAISYHWDFGDGDSSIEKNPWHTYDHFGDYNVCLTVYNECGSDTKCSILSIQDTIINRFISAYSYAYLGDAIQTNDGGFASVGTVDNNGLNSVFSKMNSEGGLVWSRKLVLSSNNNNGRKIFQTKDDGYLIIGRVNTTQRSDVLKTDSIGNMLWRKSYPVTSQYDLFFKAVETSNGDIVLAGTGTNSAQIAKLDRYGEAKWTKHYTGTGNGNDFIIDSDGNYILTGSSSSGNIYISKIDSSGNPIWSKDYSDVNGSSQGFSIIQTYDRNYVVSGLCKDPVNINAANAFVMKTDTGGNIIWSKMFDPVYNTSGAKILEDNQHHLFFLNESINNASDLIKLTEAGDVIWGKMYSAVLPLPARTYYTAAALTHDQGVILSGYATDIYCGSCESSLLIKTDSAGSSSCGDSLVNIVTTQFPLVVANFSNPPLASNAFTTETNIGLNIAYGDTIICANQTIITSVMDFHDINNSLIVYPNPSSGKIFIENNSSQRRNIKIDLYNIQGTIVRHSFFNNSENLEMDIKDVPSGFYFIRLYDDTICRTARICIVN